MTVNTYFRNPTFPATEQNLWQGIIDESIQISGFNMYYLPRKYQKLDILFGEDVLSKFDLAIPIELFLEYANGWQGQQEILTKFGLEIRDEMSYIMSKNRFQEVIAPYSTTHGLDLGYRPREGDLLYDSFTGKLLEIKFVDHNDVFYQLGNYYVYKLQCEFYQYNNETLSTGIADIDEIGLDYTNNLFDFQLLNEDGTFLLTENGETILFDNLDISADAFNNEALFKTESTLLDWSVSDPFGGT